MAELTIDQQKALALAKARQRAASGNASSVKPANTSLFGGTGRAAQAGIMQGMTANFADEILGGMMTPIEMGIDAVQGKPFDIGRSYGQAVAKTRGADRAAYEANPAAFTAGNIGGAIGTGAAAAKGGLTLMNAAKPTIASMAGRGALEGSIYGALYGAGAGEGAEGKARDALVGALTGGVLGGATGAVSGGMANRAANKAVPSLKDLDEQASALYQTARNRNTQLPRNQSARMAAEMRDIAVGEGIITPAGRINDSYTKISALIKSFDDYGTGPLRVDQMQSVRKLIGNALKSKDGDERRIAMAMMNKFHQYLDPLAPEIRQANQIWHKMKNGELIERTIDLAGSKAGQFSGSGFENALRTEFRALERQIIKGQLKGLPPAVSDAIVKVARGGRLENALRNIGKYTASGPVSGAVSFGLPFAVGNAVGGPPAGVAAGLGAIATGGTARHLATTLQSQNANAASALARSGGAPLTVPSSIKNIVQALIAAEGSQAPKMPASVAKALVPN